MKSIIYVSLKIIAIILFIVTVVPSIISMVLMITEPSVDSFSDYRAIIYWFLQIGLFSLLAIILWFKANKLSTIILRDHEQHIDIVVSKENLLEVSFIVIGVYLLVTEIPSFFSQLFFFFENRSSTGLNPYAFNSLKAAIISTVTILFAIALIMGRNKLLETIKKLKTIGT